MNSEANTQENNIEDLIRQAEIVQTKLALELQFKKNMAFFKENLPNIYNEYIKFKPQKQKIFIDNRGIPNILNIETKTFAFKSDPKEFAKKQTELFLQGPTRYTLSFRQMASWNDKHLHLKNVNNAFDDYENVNLEEKQITQGKMGLVIVVGCGLGYQLEELINSEKVENVFLYDQNKDSFYASLCTIDWEKLVRYFHEKKTCFKIVIGKSSFDALAVMRTLPREVGLFNVVQSYALIHTKSEENNKFIETYRSEFHLNATALGFFDDEHISFAHTVENCKNNFPVFNPIKPSEPNLPPVMIIGNGPSLDGLEDFIKANQEKALIISCGTSISSLYKMGIKPDLHVEMERGRTTAQWITMGTDLEYTKSLNLLCLNNVAPAVTELFKRVFITLKPNDIGAKVIKKETGINDIYELTLCNPTATNCATSYMVNMGFKEFYLIGTDYGMRSKEDHHSKNSIYHHIDKNIRKNKEYNKKEGKDYTYSDGQYPRPANFGGEVLTINSLDLSRKNIEILLSEHPDVKCFNPNDGAYIKGATPIKKEEITLAKSAIDKQALIETLLKDNFKDLKLKRVQKKKIVKNNISNLIKYKNGLLLPEECRDIYELHNELKRVWDNIIRLEKFDDISSLLVNGSIQINFGMLYISALKTKDKSTFEEVYKIGKTHYNNLITEIIDLMKNEPFRLDDSERVFN